MAQFPRCPHRAVLAADQLSHFKIFHQGVASMHRNDPAGVRRNQWPSWSEYAISGRELAEKLDVAASTLSRILKGTSRVTPEMALRLSKAIGRSPESWLAMQDFHDLWVARQTTNVKRVGKLKLAAA